MEMRWPIFAATPAVSVRSRVVSASAAGSPAGLVCPRSFVRDSLVGVRVGVSGSGVRCEFSSPNVAPPGKDFLVWLQGYHVCRLSPFNLWMGEHRPQKMAAR